MNRRTNKFHRDLQHPTKKETETMQRTKEQLQIDIENVSARHSAILKNVIIHREALTNAGAQLEYVATELKLLREELTQLGSDNPLTDINACARMLGITE